jgi:hypothetical protein
MLAELKKIPINKKDNSLLIFERTTQGFPSKVGVPQIAFFKRGELIFKTLTKYFIFTGL